MTAADSLLFLHGGGYELGSVRSDGELLIKLFGVAIGDFCADRRHDF